MITLEYILSYIAIVLFFIAVFTPFICLMWYVNEEDKQIKRNKEKRQKALDKDGCIRWNKRDDIFYTIEYIDTEIISFKDYKNKRGRD